MASGTDAIVVELAVTGVPVPPVASYTIGFDLPDNLKLTSAVDGNGTILHCSVRCPLLMTRQQSHPQCWLVLRLPQQKM